VALYDNVVVSTPSPRARSDGAYPTLLLAFAVVVWGCTPRMTALAGPHAAPLTLTTLRAIPAALALLAAMPLVHVRLPRDRQLWLWTAASGVLMVTVFLGGFTEAIIHAGPGNAIVLATTAPFWVVLLARVLYGERPSARAVGGLVVGFAGIVLIVSAQLGGDARGGELAAGMALALAAAVGWAGGTMVVKELLEQRRDVDAVALTTGQYIVGGLALVPIALVAEGTEGTDWGSGDLWLGVAFISVAGSAIATLAYFGALRHLTATRVTSWGFLSPVITVLLEGALGHAPGAVVLTGMAVTIAGVALVTSAPRRAESGEVAVPSGVSAPGP